MRRWTCALLLVGLSVVPCTPVSAWWGGGHRAIAIIAYEKMKPKTRFWVMEVLSHHPQLTQEFQIPDNLTGGVVVRDKWLLSQAAVWSDNIRGSSYDRPQWHYINQPLFLRQSDFRTLAKQVRANVEYTVPKGASLDFMRLNAPQAIEMTLSQLRSPSTKPADKALALCWLFHLVGDIHQPCHSTSLFSTRQFPDGDLGGNRVLVGKEGNLHKIWDSMLGNGNKFNDVLRRVSELSGDPKLVARAELAASILRASDWVRESHNLAKKYVYDRQIIGSLQAAEQLNQADRKPLDLPRTYYQTAGKVSRVRAMEAGYRLAALMESLQ